MTKHTPKHFHPCFVFFDVDDTLVSHKLGKVPDSTRHAIRLLQKKGIPCALATGRHLLEMEDLPGNDIPFDAYVMMNGQMIYNSDRVLTDGLPFEGINKENILSLFRAGEVPVELMEEKRMYMNFVNDRVVSVLRDVSTEPPEQMSYEGDDIFMAVCFADKNEDRRLKDLLPGCRITRWHPGGVDIIGLSGGKAEGIRRLLTRYKLDLKDAVVFGDSENDVDMLTQAGLGIAVGNGTSEAKEAADYVTDPIDEDGIYKALKHFNII